MSNKKFGLVPVDKSEIVQSFPNKPATQNAIGVDRNELLNLVKAHSSEVVSIAGDIIRGKIDIAKMEAETDAKCRILEKEIERIYCESQARIAEREQEGKVWMSKFEAREALLLDMLQRIESHPEWSVEEKKAIMEVVKALIQKD